MDLHGRLIDNEVKDASKLGELFDIGVGYSAAAGALLFGFLWCICC